MDFISSFETGACVGLGVAVGLGVFVALAVAFSVALVVTPGSWVLETVPPPGRKALMKKSRSSPKKS